MKCYIVIGENPDGDWTEEPGIFYTHVFTSKDVADKELEKLIEKDENIFGSHSYYIIESDID